MSSKLIALLFAFGIGLVVSSAVSAVNQSENVSITAADAGCCLTGNCHCPGQGACCATDSDKTEACCSAGNNVASASECCANGDCCETGNCCCPGQGDCCVAK